MSTILVVDDRSTNRQLLVTLLGYSGHTLLEAVNGVEALALAQAEHPDLVITDILMPVMDGFEFVQALRADSTLAADPEPVHPHAVDVRAARPLQCGAGRIGHRPQAGRAPRLGDQGRRTPGGAGRGVGLVGVVQLDDLDRLVERGGLGGEPHHQDRADGEVGGDQDAGARARVEPAPQPVQPLVVEAGGADDGVDAVPDAELQVVHHHVGVGEVDDDLGAGVDQRRRGVVDSPVSTRATSSRSSAASTARHTSAPTLPRAPSTPTLVRSLTGSL